MFITIRSFLHNLDVDFGKSYLSVTFPFLEVLSNGCTKLYFADSVL